MKKTLLLFVSIYFLALTACKNYGQEIDYGNLKIYYKDGVTKEMASQFGEYFVKQDMLHISKIVSMQLLKKEDHYQINVPVAKDVDINDGEYISLLSQIAGELSKQVFDNAKVEIHLCDANLDTKKVVQMEASTNWKEYKQDNYSIQYPADWTQETDVPESVAFQLVSPGSKNVIGLSLIDMNKVTKNKVTIDIVARQSIAKVSNPAITKDGHIISTTTGTKGGRDFEKISYTYTENNNKVYIEEIAYVADNVVYLLTAANAQDSVTEEDVRMDDAVLSTFTFK